MKRDRPDHISSSAMAGAKADELIILKVGYYQSLTTEPKGF
ncbi:MAG: hypothetical protein AAFO69_12435 [Bacteroidota bacterium]